MKYLLLAIVFCLSSASALAQSNDKLQSYTFKVNGICGMCKDRIEAACLRAGAKTASWDINTKMLQVSVNKAKKLNRVKRYIVAVGHDLEDQKATDKSYDRLHSCCKYERE